jgi:hypothetical protein
MGVRRVVTGEVDGRSMILADGAPGSTAIWEDLWVTAPGDPLGHAPDGADDLEPPAGRCAGGCSRSLPMRCSAR